VELTLSVLDGKIVDGVDAMRKAVREGKTVLLHAVHRAS
jgi:hypothetical protein